MQTNVLCNAALAASLSCVPALAQAGNEIVFVGSSTSGSTDQHVFAESATGNVLVASGTSFTDNVTGAVWADRGRRLYVGQSLQNRVAVADWNGASASWSTFYSANGACYGAEMDAGRQILWTLAPRATSARQLVGLDAAVGSATYGQVVAETTTLTGIRERWSLSRSGNLAAVPSALLQSGTLDVVDLDPSSSTYLQRIVTTFVPGANNISVAVGVEISTDDSYVYVCYAGVGLSAVAVWDLAAGAFLDFGALPGQQDFQLPFAVPNSMDLAIDRSFAVVSGRNTNGQPGWVGRLNFDYANPVNSTFTHWSNLVVPAADGVSLSPEGQRCAVTSTATSLSAPSELKIVDVVTGQSLQTVTLSSMWNAYTTAWQDQASVASYQAFGAGCAGSAGVPTLAPVAGSRPALGGVLQLQLTGLPTGGALVATGLSATTTSSGLPLPLDLSALGMAGCNQLVDNAALQFVIGGGGTATWSFPVPNLPSLFGATFYNQAFPFDPAANAFGWTATNGGIAVMGF